jgi:hypothetical protein
MLHDHFHPPLSIRRHWHAFHHTWAATLAASLNEQLPAGYFAEPNVQFGIEIDVAAFEEPLVPTIVAPAGGTIWQPAPPAQSVAFSIVTDTVEVQVFTERGGPTLVGAIELISPANKDRTAHREVFVGKCAGYLQQGLGLVLVDIVTSRGGNLHNELLARVAPDAVLLDTDLYAVAYHPVEREGQPQLDIWHEVLQLGGALPTLPFWLAGGPVVPLDLAATYGRTCRELRI